MKAFVLVSGLAWVAAAAVAPRLAASPPPPVTHVVRPPAPQPVLAAEAPRVYAPAPDTLVAKVAADGVIEGFRQSYARDGAPRIVVYVNRALLEPRRSAAATADAPAAPSPRLADRQTVREVERLFGRAFRHAGAQLADQAVAEALLPANPGTQLAEDKAGRERRALADIADLAIEVLISSRALTVPEVGGDVTYTVPDIQATAIRLKDAAIVGQASAGDVLGRGARAGRIVRDFSLQDITEATALALMEDMLAGRR
ncbi:MAG: hypothetical protein FJ397_05985 [Verrucomicrobia bacterium]|nr:hypothetical protein [Verrucomicrobiota bacterium]